MERPLRLILLHGFLGRPDDWSFLPAALDRRGIRIEVEVPDLWERCGRSFADVVDEVAAFDGDVIGGYSMGGRLAQCAFFRPECRARGLMVFSAHPGGLGNEAREARLAWDREWARRFETEPWPDVITAWNALPVFSGDTSGKSPTRSECSFDRHALAHALTHWSVAHQSDQRESLRNDPRPVLWMAGERDPKYVAVTRDVAALNDLIDTRVLPRAGHRLLRDAPERIADAAAEFLRNRVPASTVDP